MIGIPLGLLYGNAGEWLIHKYVLHHLGKNKNFFFAFHWHEHHKNCRKHLNEDPDYIKPLLRWHAPGKEAVALTGLCLAHLPLAPVAPFFTGTVVYCSLNYYFKHKKGHLDPQWLKENLPWHWDHHLGKNQDANWCVTHPFFDYLMGTREFSQLEVSSTESRLQAPKLGRFLNRIVRAQSRIKRFAQAARHE